MCNSDIEEYSECLAGKLQVFINNMVAFHAERGCNNECDCDFCYLDTGAFAAIKIVYNHMVDHRASGMTGQIEAFLASQS